MAEWSKDRKDSSQINSGNEFTTNDNLAVDELNAIVNNSFYAVNFAEAMADEPDISEIAGDGSPSVSLVTNGKFKRFKFSNLKGKKGDKGDRGDKGERGESGESNAMIKYLGSISVPKMTLKELKVLINQTFGTSCYTYYLVPYNRDYRTDIIVSDDGGVLGYLKNKWTGEIISVNDTSIHVGKTLSVTGGTGALFNQKPIVGGDYIKITGSPFLTSMMNVNYSWSGYELDILDAYDSTYIQCLTAKIKIYGVIG